VDGRLVFCATETAQAYAGHVEGAILAGQRAAAPLLTTLGR
jgi:monoamine oxidase